LATQLCPGQPCLTLRRYAAKAGTFCSGCPTTTSNERSGRSKLKAQKVDYTVWTVHRAHDAVHILLRRTASTLLSGRGSNAFFDRYLLSPLRRATKSGRLTGSSHEPGGRLNNHYAWHKLGLSMIGVFYGGLNWSTGPARPERRRADAGAGL